MIDRNKRNEFDIWMEDKVHSYKAAGKNMSEIEENEKIILSGLILRFLTEKCGRADEALFSEILLHESKSKLLSEGMFFELYMYLENPKKFIEKYRLKKVY